MKKNEHFDIILKFQEIFPLYNYSNVKYKNYHTKVDIICPIHGLFKQSPKAIINHKNGCVHCTKKITILNFKDKSNNIHDNKYDYSKVEFISSTIKVDIICPIHGLFKQKMTNHIHYNQGCPKCSSTHKSNINLFIKRGNIIHNNKYDYSNVLYINSTTKVDIICPIHGLFKQMPQSHINKKTGCPECNESKGEKIINNFLIDNNIIFKSQKKFKDCKNKNSLPFDFYLIDYNILIEYDGIQHFQPVEYFGGELNFKIIQQNDLIKNNYCKDKNIKLIRIPYNCELNYKLEEIKNELKI
jgi:hypothetical protein